MVSGVVPDDHPETAPGTLVLPDNSDVDGRIEESGDVDVFTVPTAGFEMLTFRVTGLAQGMAPRLRIFKQDGITEIMSATIDQLVENAPYVAVYVPVNGDAELHAEVSHTANGTGIYQFSAGKPIFSDPPKHIDIDIKPASCPNPMRLKCNGVLPAAILGTEAFDVTTINPETIMITRAGLSNAVPLIRHSYEDVGTPFGGTPCDCHALGKDGYTDVSLKFMVSAVVEGLRLYELADRDTVALSIVGKTYNGTPIRGEDCILVLGELRKECNSDLDCDADVDGTDAAMFKEEYGRRNCSKNNPCFGDFTSDGDVDGTDVFTFRSEFGTIFR
jgi:hypothetical protein